MRQEVIQEIINSTQTPIMILDDNWVIKMFNKEAEIFTGYNSEEVIGIKSIKDIKIHHKNQKKLFEKLTKEGKVTDYGTYLIRKDGEKIPVTLSLSKLFHKNSDKAYDIVVFILERPQTDREKQYIKILKNSDKKMKQCKSYIRDRFELFRLVKHDSENSYMIAKNFLDIILQGFLGDLQEKQEEKLYNVNLEVQKIRSSIYDFYYISKMDLKLLELEPTKVDILECVEKEYDNFSKVYMRKGFNFAKDFQDNLPEVYFDKQILGQVLFDLFVYSVRQSGQGGTVELKLSRQQEPENRVLIEFKISEPKMSEEDRKFVESVMREHRKSNGKSEKKIDLPFLCANKLVEYAGEDFWTKEHSFFESSVYLTLPIAD